MLLWLEKIIVILQLKIDMSTLNAKRILICFNLLTNNK